jgi:2-hydroxymuconate-semialdehyde hydrolase
MTGAHAVAERAPRHSAGAARARMLAALPLEARRVFPCGIPTAVLEGGEGPPLLLLHGGIECGGAIWAPVAARLAASRRVVVPDLPGLGESAPLARLDAAAFTEWLAAFVRESCPEGPTLVAHSLAGSLAARFAARHGELVRRLVLYGAPGIGPYRMPIGLRATAVRFALRPSERNAERFERWAFADLDRARGRDPEWFAAFSGYTRQRAAVPQVKRTMRRLVTAGTERVPDAELARIEVPTTLVWGRHDRFVPLGLAQAASRRLGWSLHVVDDAGHVPHVERPGAFLQALRAGRS